MIYYNILIVLLSLIAGFFFGANTLKDKKTKKNKFEYEVHLPPPLPTTTLSNNETNTLIPDKQLTFELALKKVFTLRGVNPQGNIEWVEFRDAILRPEQNAPPAGYLRFDKVKISWSYQDEYLKLEFDKNQNVVPSNLFFSFWESTEPPNQFILKPFDLFSGTPLKPITKSATYDPVDKSFLLSFKNVNFKVGYVYIILGN